jgi:hypothetical protein
MWKEGGASRFTRGIAPCLLRAGPANAVGFFLMEMTVRACVRVRVSADVVGVCVRPRPRVCAYWRARPSPAEWVPRPPMRRGAAALLTHGIVFV